MFLEGIFYVYLWFAGFHVQPFIIWCGLSQQPSVIKFRVEWITHLHFVSHLGAFENLSLYTHMYQSALHHHVLNIWVIRAH